MGAVPPKLPGVSTMPDAESVVITSVTTAATGSNWTAFASAACDALDLINNTGVTVEYRRGGAGSTVPVPTGASRLIVGIANANEIGVRRVDVSNTQVVVQAEALTY